MNFCEKCRYLYNITKDVKTKTAKISNFLDNIFAKYVSGEKFTEEDIKKITMKDILDDERYDNMTKKDQKGLTAAIKVVDKTFFNISEEEIESQNSNISAHFICKQCKNTVPIKPGTLIYSKNYNVNTYEDVIDYNYVIHDCTLPRTAAYICKNPKCKTIKDPTLREAVMIKNSNGQQEYVCTICVTHWTYTL